MKKNSGPPNWPKIRVFAILWPKFGRNDLFYSSVLFYSYVVERPLKRACHFYKRTKIPLNFHECTFKVFKFLSWLFGPPASARRVL